MNYIYNAKIKTMNYADKINSKLTDTEFYKHYAYSNAPWLKPLRVNPDNFFDNAIMSMIKGQWKGANPFTPPDVPVNFTEAIGLGILNAETIKNNLIELAKVRKGD